MVCATRPKFAWCSHQDTRMVDDRCESPPATRHDSLPYDRAVVQWLTCRRLYGQQISISRYKAKLKLKRVNLQRRVQTSILRSDPTAERYNSPSWKQVLRIVDGDNDVTVEWQVKVGAGELRAHGKHGDSENDLPVASEMAIGRT